MTRVRIPNGNRGRCKLPFKGVAREGAPGIGNEISLGLDAPGPRGDCQVPADALHRRRRGPDARCR